ncbi:MAG: hypothetical protein KGO50_07435 [Myxococcales bacterium]|nr:hypothetical protein [Myxococcales bacterium]
MGAPASGGKVQVARYTMRRAAEWRQWWWGEWATGHFMAYRDVAKRSGSENSGF